MEHDEFVDNASEILPFLFLGSEEAGHAPISVLQKHGITHIVVAGFGISKLHDESGGICYFSVKAIDVSGYQIIQDILPVKAFLEDVERSGGRVLVHCARGRSRSAALVVGFLMARFRISFAEAHQRVRARRDISINDDFKTQLRLFEQLNFTLDGYRPPAAPRWRH